MNLPKENLLKIFHFPHLSEKASIALEKKNTVAFKVNRNCTKKEIKDAANLLFKASIKTVRVLIVKGKLKRYGNKYGRRKNWKKAYVSFKEGQNLDFLSKNTDK